MLTWLRVGMYALHDQGAAWHAHRCQLINQIPCCAGQTRLTYGSRQARVGVHLMPPFLAGCRPSTLVELHVHLHSKGPMSACVGDDELLGAVKEASVCASTRPVHG